MAKGVANKERRVRLELDIVAEVYLVIRRLTSLMDNQLERRITV